MSTPSADDDDKLDPEAARMIARVRSLMLIAGLTTMLAIAAVLAVIGYRVFTLQGSVPAASEAVIEAIATLPKGARVLSATAAGDRVVVTVDVGGTTEIRTFDVRSLKPAGRLQFKTGP